MEKLQKQLDPVKFAEELLTYQGKPLRLYQFQKDFLRDIDWLHDMVACQKGRAVGASFMIAIGLTYAAWLHSDARFAILSKTEEQAGFIFAHVKRFFQTSEMLKGAIDSQKTTKDELHLTNGSIVVHRTMGARGDTMRGFHCEGRGALIIDEGSSCPTDAITTCYPSAVDAAIIHVSTPKQPAGEFHRVCTADPDFRVIKIPSTISPRISQRHLDFWKRIYSPSRYRNEVLGEFAAGEDSVFDADSIDKAIDDALPIYDANKGFTQFDLEANYVYSLDISRIGADKWALTIGEVDDRNNSLRVVAYQSWIGSRNEKRAGNAIVTDNPDAIIKDILGYAHCYYPLKIYCDATSNEFFCHTLRHRHNLPVEEVVWSTSKKQRLIEHLASCLRAGKVKIPRDDEIIAQLVEYAYDKKKMEDDSDRKIYLAGEDDFVASLAMLAQAISWETDAEFFEMIEVF